MKVLVSLSYTNVQLGKHAWRWYGFHLVFLYTISSVACTFSQKTKTFLNQFFRESSTSRHFFLITMKKKLCSMIFGIAAYQEHGTAQLILWLLMLVATRKTRNKQFKRIKRRSIMERAHAWRPARNRRGESGSKFSFVLFSLRYKKKKTQNPDSHTPTQESCTSR